MKPLMLILLALAALWAGVTIFFGSTIILTNGPVPEGAKLIHNTVKTITTLLCVGLLFSTRLIMDTDLASFLGFMLRFFWLLALAFSLYTVFLGHELWMLSGLANLEQIFFLGGITILVTGSPILFSLLLHEM